MVIKEHEQSITIEVPLKEKKKFYDYVDKNWKGDGEKKEEVEETII